jgi:hypothetical protein
MSRCIEMRSHQIRFCAVHRLVPAGAACSICPSGKGSRCRKCHAERRLPAPAKESRLVLPPLPYGSRAARPDLLPTRRHRSLHTRMTAPQGALFTENSLYVTTRSAYDMVYSRNTIECAFYSLRRGWMDGRQVLWLLDNIFLFHQSQKGFVYD